MTFSSSSETGVDYVQIFRSKTGLVGLYQIDEVLDTSSPYDDSTADSSIDITLAAPTRPAPGGNASVPVFDCIAAYLGRLWGMVFSTNTVYWSEPNAPWLFPATNQMKVAPQDRDVLTGFGVARDTMFIFKRRHTYAIASVDMMEGIGGAPLLVPDVRLVDDSTGAASSHAVASVENAVYFLSGEGKIYQTPSDSGLIAMEQSPQLEDILADTYTKRLPVAELGYAEHERKLYVALTTDENAHNNQTLTLDLVSRGWTTAPGIQAESLAEFRDSDGRGRLVFGNIRGDISQLGLGFAYGASSGTLSGTVTGATASTLSDSTATFDSGIVGLPIHLYDSDYALVQSNMIAARDSATKVTVVWGWDTVPSSGTYYYAIGACVPEWKFGWLDFTTWAYLKRIRVTHGIGSGNCGIYIAVDDNDAELVDYFSLAERGVHETCAFAGGKRFQTSIVGFEGAGDFEVIQVEWDIDQQAGGI